MEETAHPRPGGHRLRMNPLLMTDTLPLPTNPSGCARTEIVALKTVAFKWKYRCHFREFHNRGAERGLVEKEVTYAMPLLVSTTSLHPLYSLQRLLFVPLLH